MKQKHANLPVLMALMLGISGCVVGAPDMPSNPPNPRPGGGGADACDAGAYRQLIGVDIDESGLVEGPFLRIIRPGDFVTEDFRPDRANVIVNRGNRIRRAYCG